MERCSLLHLISIAAPFYCSIIMFHSKVPQTQSSPPCPCFKTKQDEILNFFLSALRVTESLCWDHIRKIMENTTQRQSTLKCFFFFFFFDSLPINLRSSNRCKSQIQPRTSQPLKLSMISKSYWHKHDKQMHEPRVVQMGIPNVGKRRN